MRSSKLMMAEMRSRSWLFRIDLGVRCKTPMNSSRVLGVYWGALVGVLAEVLAGRNLSSLGSSHRMNFRIIVSNMI